MAVTLRELIDQVRAELLAPPEGRNLDALIPFLFVDEIELEVGVTVSTTVEGAGKVTLLVVELGGGGERAHEQAHRVKVKMSPLLTKEEVRAQLREDPRLWARVQHYNLAGTLKDVPLVGED